MKKISIIIVLLSITLAGMAQSVDLRRKIEVNGTAEKEVTPDIINVSISLKEYIDGKTKVTISQLETQLEKAVNEAGIPKEDFTINNLSGYNYTYQKKKNPDFLASKQYGIRFHDLNRFNQIMSKLDAKGIQSTNIDSYDYSKINELKNELKLKALLNAKEKAAFLLTGIGEKLGGAIDIVENEDSNFSSPRPVMYMAKAAMADAAPESDIDVKKIKLSFQVHAVFEIAK
ncbi:SIMPL domain-containing protein [Mucilaginibacter mali]|uniref:SIMPL domain-containing protein n=1 Tax=Mucilaginibacter mali TaxID=2740462 RepID=A0A7D4PWU9_9SPHI|nr:SIMPL domain-containing protein [Mucilaginibacter mali]QKJ32003.1 SIMPL domain-containing protein [Mucilaginibacter mali]